jgi:beta-N-acetylhexosaminidase
MIMTAHVVYDDLDPATIATTSPRIVRDLLRASWGYDGLVVSDDLDMVAAQGLTPAEMADALTAADVDLALVGRDLDRAEALARAFPPAPATRRRLAAALTVNS